MSQTNKTIQQKMSELSAIVAWFDSDDFSLEQAMDKFKQAEKLSEEIEQDLMTLKNEVKIVKEKFDKET
jgi:exodeoxyribonuclease VII small subunit